MKEKICKFIGKEVLVFHCSIFNLEMNFEDGEIKIKNGDNLWRVVYNNKIIASTRDAFVFKYDELTEEGIASDLIEIEEWENDDFDYTEVIYERLENHRDAKIRECAELIENSTLTDITESHSNDFVFTFDNGVILQVYSIVQKDTPLIEIR